VRVDLLHDHERSRIARGPRPLDVGLRRRAPIARIGRTSASRVPQRLALLALRRCRVVRHRRASLRLTEREGAFPMIDRPSRRVLYGLSVPPLAWALQGLSVWFLDWRACPYGAACASPGGPFRGIEL